MTAWLLIDVGNTSLKWQVITFSGAPSLHELFALTECSEIHRIANSDVTENSLATQWQSDRMISKAQQVEFSWLCVGPQATSSAVGNALGRLEKWCLGRGSCAGEAALLVPRADVSMSNARPHRLVNDYRDARQLGADRWASALGLLASDLCHLPSCHLVVGAGTATTIDLIEADSGGVFHFRGGWIFPGVRLMHQTLRTGTTALEYGLDSDAVSTVAARDSSTAIASGIAWAQAGMMDRLIAQHSVETVWLHGGDAPLWKKFYDAVGAGSAPIREVPALVFAGLAASRLISD